MFYPCSSTVNIFFSPVLIGLDVFYVESVCAADGTSALSSLPLPSVAGVCLSPDEAAHSCTALQTSTVEQDLFI